MLVCAAALKQIAIVGWEEWQNSNLKALPGFHRRYLKHLLLKMVAEAAKKCKLAAFIHFSYCSLCTFQNFKGLNFSEGRRKKALEVKSHYVWK